MISQGSIDLFLRSLEENGASEHTVRAYKGDLTALLDWVTDSGTLSPPTDWTIAERCAAKYLTEKRTEWKPRTTNRKLAAFRSWAFHAGNPTFLQNYRAPTPAPLEPHPVSGGIDTVMDMLAAVSTRGGKWKTLENHHRALIALTGLCGLRISEAVKIEWTNFDVTDPDNRRLTVRGKGDKDRVIFVSDRAWEAIQPSYERARASITSSRLVNLSVGGAARSITRHAIRAGHPEHVASHDMRMTAGTAAYEASGSDLRAVQAFLGHASSRTTEGYTAVSVAASKRAASF